MPNSHISFTEAMLQPGFFDDSPNGSIESTESVSTQDVKPTTLVSEPVVSQTLPPFLPFSKFPKQHEIIKPPLLIDGLLHQGSKAVWAGSSKSYKSWSVMDLGISIATGTDFWGRETRKGGVIFMDFELSPCFAQDRLWSILHGKGLTAPPPNFLYWPLRGKCYDPARVLEVLEERINSFAEVSCIIADPVYKLSSTIDENHAGSVTQLLLSLEKFSESTGAAIVFTHHFNKSASGANNDHINKMSGSGSFARDPDTIVTMSRHPSEPNCLVIESTLRNLKSPGPFVIEADPPHFTFRDDVEVPLTRPINDQSTSKEDVLSILSDAKELSPRDWETKSIQKFGITAKQFEKLVAQLRSLGCVYLKKDGDGYLWKAEEE